MRLTPLQSAIAYCVEGCAIGFGNTLIILAILLRRALRGRKELLIIVALSFGEGVLGYSYLTMGVYRVIFLMTDANMWPAYTALDCAIRTPTLGFFYSAQCSSIMLVMISVDRYLAVSAPAKYMKLTALYVYRMAGVIYVGYGVTTVAAVIGQSYLKGTNVTYSPICYGTWVVTEAYYTFHITMQVALSIASCLLYAAVVFKLYRRSSAVVGAANASRHKHAKSQQDKVTKVVSLVILSTLLLFCIPYAASTLRALFAVRLWEPFAWLADKAWILAGLNSVTNVLIYGFRHADIRRSIRSAFGCGVGNEVTTIHVSKSQGNSARF